MRALSGVRGQACAVMTEGARFTWALAGDTAVVVRARSLVQGALSVLGVASEVVGDAEVGVAELVTNAVRHAQPPVELGLRITTRFVMVEVRDGSPVLPVWPPVEDAANAGCAGEEELDRLIASLDEHGRGLTVVERLTRGCCGAHRLRAAGKVVWFACELPVAGAA